jgi:hypothetical protein
MMTIARSSFLGALLLEATTRVIVGRFTTSCQTIVNGTNGLGSALWYAISGAGAGGIPEGDRGLHCSLELGFSSAVS